MIDARINRRRLLRGMGGIGVALPFLDSMSMVRAAGAPKRFVVFYTPHGTSNPGLWGASGEGTGFTLRPEVAALEPYKKDLLMLSGLDMKSTEGQEAGPLHSLGMAHMLTCAKSTDVDGYGAIVAEKYYFKLAGGQSIDQKIASHVGKENRFASLQFGVQTSVLPARGHHPEHRMIYSAPKTMVPNVDDPRVMFTRLFSTPLSGDPATSIERSFAQRRSVLDFVSDDYRALNAQVGAADRQKLEGHLTAIRAVEKTLQNPTVTSCRFPATAPAATDLKTGASFPTLGKQQMDLLTLALACDLTRVASIQFAHAASHLVQTWNGATIEHHTSTHQPATDGPLLAKINAWYTAQLAYLIKSMKAIGEGASTLLDNSLVFYCSEVAHGPTHIFKNMRSVLVGSCGGYFKTGRAIKYTGEPCNKLMVSFLHAMGINEDAFGDPKQPKGPLSGLT